MADRVPKVATSFRLSSAALALIEALSQKQQMGRSTILENAVRDYARQQGIDVNAVIAAALEEKED